MRLTEESFSSCAVHHKNGEDVSGQVRRSNKEALHVNCQVWNRESEESQNQWLSTVTHSEFHHIDGRC